MPARGFGSLSSGQRSANAKKAAATRKANGTKSGFASLSPQKRHSSAIKAAATRRSHGQKVGFAKLSPAQRHAMAQKAAATRLAKLRASGKVPSLATHNRLHKTRKSSVFRQPKARKLNPNLARKTKNKKLYKVKRLNKSSRAKRMII